MLSDIYLQITLFPPYGFTVSFLCCLWQYFLSCRRQAQGSEISVLQIGAHPQGEAAFILQSGFLFSTSLSPAACLSSCCAQPKAERSLMEEVLLPSSISHGGHEACLPFLSYCTVLTAVRKKNKLTHNSNFTVGLKEGNKRILYI